MESMLSMASVKMTNLDLGGQQQPPSSDKSRSSSSSDDMLSTPKPLALMSPRTIAKRAALVAGSLTNGNDDSDDMLTTPVVTTPKATDLWSIRDQLPLSLPSFSPSSAENLSTPGARALSSPTPLELAQQDRLADLPMDSDIGLRSPCDGLLARRRKYKTARHAASNNSVNSDSNSCDTPTSSQNSPRDLTMSRTIGLTNGGCSQDHESTSNQIQVKLEVDESKDVGKQQQSQLPRSPGGSSVGMSLPSSQFKHPSSSSSSTSSGTNKPENLRFNTAVTPSPLAVVPSPNWSAVERMFGPDLLTKTPKQLDSTIFDFLSPPPVTPRGSSSSGGPSSKLGCFQPSDRSSPGNESERYLGRDQRLSPRLSPRFPIPEAPTDLSSKSNNSDSSSVSQVSSLSTTDPKIPPLTRLDNPPPYPDAAQDLSTTKRSLTPPSLSQIHHHQQLQVKQEYLSADENVRSRTPSGGGNANLVIVPGNGIVKTEMTNDEYGYRQSSASVNSQPTFTHSFYLPQGGTNSLHNIYNNRSGVSNAGSGGVYQDLMVQRQPLTNSMDLDYDQQQQQQGGFSSWGLENRSQQWPPAVQNQDDEDASMSPPPAAASAYHPPPLHTLSAQSSPNHGNKVPAISIKSSHSLSASPISMTSLEQPAQLSQDRKRRGKAASAKENGVRDNVGGGNDTGSTTPKKRNKGKGKATSQVRDPNGAKRVYTCPHCQRSYDWNYNLNRHLKYECGKENAFQCSKCGRKFPHKQNCVYHLKRKHKIVCETIDQYMASGLVLFRGSSGPAGQQAARPSNNGSNNGNSPNNASNLPMA